MTRRFWNRDQDPGDGTSWNRITQMQPRRGSLAVVALTMCVVPVSRSQQAEPASSKPKTLPTVVVTATRIPEPAFDVPAAIGVVTQDKIVDGAPAFSLSQSLARIPGVVAQNRQSYAQDSQLSIRGFGSRASFGVRGIRLLVDGIPVSGPDGQGETDPFDLATAARIEVLRGPFSALYGNAAGSVIQIVTKDGPPQPTFGGSTQFGSYSTRIQRLDAGGTADKFNYVVDGTHFHTNGYREHSKAERNNLRAKLRYDLGNDSSLTLLFNGENQPFAQDPSLASAPLDLILGVEYDRLNELRKGWVNNKGVEEELRRNEDDLSYQADEYAQAEWKPGRWRIVAGLRHSRVKFGSDDHYVTAEDPDDSGKRSFASTNPIAGVLYKINPHLNLYANYGRGFETPTLSEFAYRPDGKSGFNEELQPSKSRDYEAGLKGNWDSTSFDLAVFKIAITDDIIVGVSNEGRDSLTNAASTKRHGLELNVEKTFWSGFGAYLAYSYLQAHFDDGPLDGNQMPGVPRQMVYGELNW